MVIEIIYLTVEEVYSLSFQIFTKYGTSPDHARTLAATVAAAEKDECYSHGLFRIPSYVASIISGKVTPDSVPVINDIAPSVVQVDAKNGFAPLALEVGRDPLASKCKTQGVSILSVVNCYHWAALWPEIEALAKLGLVAIACTSYIPCVAPAGGTQALFGTNPIAFGWPRGEGIPPFVFDQAMSASARGEIMICQRDGKSIPEGWALDKDGSPTTDPAAALAGTQLAFGGYKGSAFALMVELLSGALIGECFSYESEELDNGDGGPVSGGEFILAINPPSCMATVDGTATSASQLNHAERLFDKILEQDGTRLPSDRRYEARRRTSVEGVKVSRTLYNTLVKLNQ